MSDIDELKIWLDSRDLEIYEPPSFEERITLYHTKLIGPGLASIVNGDTRGAEFKTDPGWFKFNWLIEVLGRVSFKKPAHFFEIKYESSGYCPNVYPLTPYLFANNQSVGGVQDILVRLDMGAACVILAPFTREWLLECSLSELDFDLTLGGSRKFCEEVCFLLGITKSENV